MATFIVTTTANIDTLSGKTGGDTYTINGGTLVIDQDSRSGLNQSASAVLGSITISSTLGGKVSVDASGVREIQFNSGGGVVPAFNTTISQGGASGLLCAVYSSLSSGPLNAGDVMPLTGYIKIKRWNSVAFTSGALTGISATSTGADVQGWLEVVGQESLTVTVPRLGKFYVNENNTQLFYKIGTTNGSAGQVLQTPTFGGTNSYCAGVYIDNGSGGYDLWNGVQGAAFSSTHFSTDERAQVFHSLPNGEIRFGNDGTTNVGLVPPSGRGVYIGAVILRNAVSTTKTLNAVPNTTMASRYDFTTTYAGDILINSAMGDWFLSFTSAYRVKINYTAIHEQFYFSNNASRPEIKFSMTGVYLNLTTASYYALYNGLNSLGILMEDCRLLRYGGASNAFCIYSIGGVDGVFNRNTFGLTNFTRVINAYVIYNNQCLNFSFTGTNVVNGQIYNNASFNITFDGIDYCDRYVGTTQTTLGIYTLGTAGTCDNIVAKNVTFGLNGLIADVHPYLGVFNSSFTSNSLFHTAGSDAAPIGGTTNAPAYIFVDGGNNSGISIKRIFLNATRTALYTAVNSSKGIVFENLRGTVGSVATSSNNTQVKSVRSASNSVAGQSACYGTHFMSMFDTDTTGRFWLAMNEPTEVTNPYITQVSLGAGAGFSSAGQISMPNSGDEVIWETSDIVKGFTAFQNVAPTLTGTLTGNFTYEYDINTGSGFSGTWKTLNGTNLSAETITPSGFYFKIRVVCTVANSTNAITYIRLSMTTTATDQRELYPIIVKSSSLSLTQLATGTLVKIFKVSDDSILYTATTTGSTFTYNFSWIEDDGDVDVYALIWHEDYYTIRLQGLSLTSTAQSIPISQVDDFIYLAGSSLTSFTIDTTNKIIVLGSGTTELDIVDLYSQFKDWIATGDNAKFPRAFDPIGGDTITGSTTIPAYLYLKNGYKIRPQDADHTLNVTNGILLVLGGGDPFLDTVSPHTVRINYQQPVQAITVSTSGGSGATAADVWSYGTRTLSSGGVSAIQSGLATQSSVDDIPLLSEIEASSVLAKKSHVNTVNEGVQKASLLIPHNTNIT